jgi:cell division septation protein DedD
MDEKITQRLIGVVALVALGVTLIPGASYISKQINLAPYLALNNQESVKTEHHLSSSPSLRWAKKALNFEEFASVAPSTSPVDLTFAMAMPKKRIATSVNPTIPLRPVLALNEVIIPLRASSAMAFNRPLSEPAAVGASTTAVVIPSSEPVIGPRRPEATSPDTTPTPHAATEADPLPPLAHTDEPAPILKAIPQTESQPVPNTTSLSAPKASIHATPVLAVTSTVNVPAIKTKTRSAAWYVQLGSLKNKENIQHLLRLLDKKGYQVTTKVKTNGQTRVYVAPSNARLSEKELIFKLAQDTHITGFVVSSKKL